MAIGIFEESSKDFSGLSVERSVLDLHDKLREMELYLCGRFAGVFSLSHLVPMNPGE